MCRELALLTRAAQQHAEVELGQAFVDCHILALFGLGTRRRQDKELRCRRRRWGRSRRAYTKTPGHGSTDRPARAG
jgi:hypothetical protein